MKKIISLVLCVIMVMAIVPMTVAAEGELVETLIYENTFDSAEDLTKDGATISSSSNVKHTSDGVVQIVGSSKSPSSTWLSNFDVSETQNGKVKFEIRLVVPSSASKGGNMIYLNGTNLVAVNGGTPARFNLLGEGSTKTTIYPSADYGQNVNVGILLTIEYDMNSGDVTMYTVQGGDTSAVITRNIGADTDGQVTLQMGNGSNRNTWYFDDVRLYAYVSEQAEEPVEPEVPAIDPVCTMEVDAYQTSAVAEGKYNVRFAGVLKYLPAGSDKVGFEISAPAFGKNWDLSTDTVYNSLTASFGAETVTAEERGGQYITAAAITGIPVGTGAIEFVITPYVTFMIDGVETKIYGEAKTVTVPAVE